MSDAAGGMPLVRLAGVGFSYGGDPVLSAVDLTVGQHDFVGVVGPSGSGKTTLLRLLLGTARPTRGTVTRAPGLRIGYVPQLETVDWDFPVTVAECVLMGRPGRGLPWPTRAERRDVARVLDRLGIGNLAGRHIRALSGGQQQRMFIARALLGFSSAGASAAACPSLLLMDEPTTGVDLTSRHDMLHLLGELNAGGGELASRPGGQQRTAILLTTHDLNGVAAHLPKLVALNGTVVAAGAPREVITGPVLERTFGAPMEVLTHLGLPVVLDPQRAPSAAHLGVVRDAG